MFEYRNAIIALLILGTGNAFASSQVPKPQEKEPEKKPETCCLIPRCNNCFGVGLDLIAWTPCVDGIDCNFGNTTITSTTTSGVTTTTIVQNDKGVSLGWQPGVRFGVAYTCCKCFDADVVLTLLQGKKKSSNSSGTFNWKMSLGNIDTSIACKVPANNCCEIKPTAGLRGLQMKQTLNIDVTTAITSGTTTSTVTTTDQDSQKFAGVGPRVGVLGTWFFNCGIDAFAALDSAILLGKLTTQFLDTDTTTLATKTCNATKKSGSCLSITDLALGLRWRTACMIISAALENHNYSNFNHLGCGGDLNIFGANLGAGFTF